MSTTLDPHISEYEIKRRNLVCNSFSMSKNEGDEPKLWFTYKLSLKVQSEFRTVREIEQVRFERMV
jgi:hypothetical protein